MPVPTWLVENKVQTVDGKTICPMCEGNFAVREGATWQRCPRCDGTGVEPSGLTEIVITVRTFFSFVRKAWISALDVRHSTKDVTKEEILAIIQDLEQMISNNRVIKLPDNKDEKIQ